MSAKSKASDIPSRNAIRTSSSTSYTSGAGVYRGYAADLGVFRRSNADFGRSNSLGAIREHSKFVEALLRSSSRQMESTTPTPGAATPELRDARDSLSTPLASVHAGTSSAPATMATPASTSDITTPGSKTAIPSPAPALATTEPLLPRAASSLGSSELDSLRMSVSMVGNLTLLRDITMDVSRIVAESALKGLEPHECSVLKQKVDLQLRCIASLSRSRPLK
ncbi:hypothetical protein HK105_208655 [Polyrhizophydium stewartii]|uniref:Uncharacterized protein n=1 Tax=Polyrhizophydium stewartii TaxID=2732419 RepID=A0ABR4MX85_9FUNG